MAMSKTQNQQSIFDEEMTFLSNIQTRFSHTHGQVPVEHQDPDVKRLIEAMGAFMAKGRLAGTAQIDQLHKRVFQQLLPYISSPIASMGLLQGNTRYLTEATQIKKGSNFSITSDDDDKGEYQSLHNSPLKPIMIEKVGYASDDITTGETDSQIKIMIKSYTQVPGPLTHLPVYLSINNNFGLTCQFIKMLSQNMVSVAAVFDGHDLYAGRFSFGKCESQKLDNANENLVIDKSISEAHPIDKIRRFFQLPQQENYLNLYFDGSPQRWKSCELKLILNAPWPNNIKLSADFFKLGIICVENIVKQNAESFSFDATQSAHPVRPLSTSPDLKLLKCLGVYQGALKDKHLLRPGILQSGNGAYELHLQGDEHPLIDIQLTEAFTQPVKITLEAQWHQPNFSAHLWKKLTARTIQLDITGLECLVYTPPVPFVPLSDNQPHSLLELSLLKNKDVLSLEEIIFILESLGSVFAREFRSVKPLLNELHILSIDHYAFVIPDIDLQTNALLECFLKKLQQLLKLWLPHNTTKITIQNQIKPSLSEESQEYRENELIPEGFEISESQKQTSKASEDKEEGLIPISPDHWLFFEDEIAEYGLKDQDASHV